MAPAISTLIPGDGHAASGIDHSSLLFVSKHGLPQWFFFSRMDKIYQGSSIPRFTKEQMDAQVEEFKDFHFTEHVKLKDLMATTTSLSCLPLEEATFENWTYGRAVCVGDAIHKMTPNVSPGSPDQVGIIFLTCYLYSSGKAATKL
jgi:FAD dependent monooxygenase